MTKIALDIETKDLEFAERVAIRDRFNGPDEVLNCILNSAISKFRTEVNDLTPEQEEIKWLKALVDLQRAKINVLMEMFADAQKCIIHQHERLLDEDHIQIEEPFRLSDFEEDPGGGMRLKSNLRQPDLDYEIPF